MLVQGNSRSRARLGRVLLFFSALGISPETRSDTDKAPERCFRFDTKVTRPLRDTPTESSRSGKLANGVVWAQVRGEARRPLKSLVEDLIQHRPTRSERVSEMRIHPVDSAHYLTLHDTHSIVRPFPFVTVEWDERWGFALLQGTPDSPEKVLVSYEKTGGTSHIKHLCGSILLERKAGIVELYLYQEIQASQRTEKETLDGQLDTLKRIRREERE